MAALIWSSSSPRILSTVRKLSTSSAKLFSTLLQLLLSNSSDSCCRSCASSLRAAAISSFCWLMVSSSCFSFSAASCSNALRLKERARALVLVCVPTVQYEYCTYYLDNHDDKVSASPHFQKGLFSYFSKTKQNCSNPQRWKN